MSTVAYSLQDNKLNNQEGYLPRTVINKTYSTRDLVKRMHQKNLGLTEGQIENFFRGLVNMTGEIGQEGSAINISNVLHIKPIVKGRFESMDDTFDPVKHSIILNANISVKFSEKFMKDVVPVRVDRTRLEIDFREINGKRPDSSTLLRHDVNKIVGSGLMPYQFKFPG